MSWPGASTSGANVNPGARRLSMDHVREIAGAAGSTNYGLRSRPETPRTLHYPRQTMKTSEPPAGRWREYRSPLKIVLLAINGLCFGACLVLLTTSTPNNALVFLTVGTGLMFGAGLTGALIASRHAARESRMRDVAAAQP
jgi:hypothetical protein